MDFYILKRLGEPVLLEQTAEESAELTQACLKLARKIRGENPTPKDINELKNNLTEEIADVVLCIQTLIDINLVDPSDINEIVHLKEKRWVDRLNETK